MDSMALQGVGKSVRSRGTDSAAVLGQALGNGACLISLRRTKIGAFDVKDAWDLMELKKRIIETAPPRDEDTVF